MIKILYFAWLKSKIGTGAEEVELPETVQTVGDMLDYLKTRSDAYAEALGDDKMIRVALNQEYAEMNTPLKAGDEFAIFPPVTGG